MSEQDNEVGQHLNKEEDQILEINQIDNIPQSPEYEDVNIKTSRIIELSRKAGYKVFEVKALSGRWFVVAEDKSAVINNQGLVTVLDKYEDTLDPHDLAGNCGPIHDEAKDKGLGNGIMYTAKADYGAKLRSIYPGHFHRIAYKDSGKKTIYFDLTAKANIFAPHSQPSRAIASGIMIIEPLGQTKGINNLYGVQWERE